MASETTFPKDETLAGVAFKKVTCPVAQAEMVLDKNSSDRPLANEAAFC